MPFSPTSRKGRRATVSFNSPAAPALPSKGHAREHSNPNTAITTELTWKPQPEIFSAQALHDDGGLDAAVAALQPAIQTSDSNLTAVIAGLLDVHPSILPLLLSYDTELNGHFAKIFNATFPSTANLYVDSIFQRIIDNLKLFYFSLPPDAEGDGLSELHSTMKTIQAAIPALRALKLIDLDFSASISPTSPRASALAASPTSPVIEDDNLPFLKKKNQQRSKKSRALSMHVDDSAFRAINAKRPQSPEEVRKLEITLLEEQKRILEAYISHLLLSVCHEHAKALSLSRDTEEVAISQHKHTQTQKRQIKGEFQSVANETSSETSAPLISGSHAVLSILNPISKIQTLEEDIEGFGAWRILLSNDAMGYLRQSSRKDRHMFEIVWKKMKELSNGFFSKSNQKRLVGQDSEVPVYEAKMTSDTRLVYIIDCIPEDDGKRVTQAIKMFGVYTHAQINSRLWSAVASWSTRRGAEYRSRCLFRQTSKQHDGYVSPGSWPPIRETYESSIEDLHFDYEVTLQLHSLLTHEKFVPFTKTVLNSILADQDSTHPFSVSPLEHEIIYHPSSCFVIGRSGTGKTTTMLFKMLGIERTSRKIGDRKIRQVFVTQSRVLAEKVEEYFNNMIQSYAGELQSAEELEWRASRRKEAEKDLVELDEEDDSLSNLPTRFCDLEDKHFPLFVTFDKLCKLLEADSNTIRKEKSHTSRALSNYKIADLADVELSLQDDPGMTMEQRQSAVLPSDQKILYEHFCSAYWPHLPQSLKKGFDPALVWSEFQGVIRGSEMSLQSNNGYLDRDSYENLSFRKQATFARHRSALYDLFEAYMKQKREREGFDAADRTHSLLLALGDTQPTVMFDYIYIDEVQDNLMIDAKLLRKLCVNPHGMFWAGDTAQQITSTAFRFADLKAFLHRVEEADALVQARMRDAVQPKSFTLSINYRSHGGIIRCAHSIVQLLTMFWSDSIDALEKEQGLVDGPKPVFFSGWDEESVHYEQFLFGGASNRIEFGAQQCILVRNDAAREALRQKIGDVGVIMTLYESKGLEFSDVLLYNFFEDSPVRKEWRVILNAIQEGQRAGISVPTFNELRHVGVSSELKFLYVGLTRARNHLWVWDSSEHADSMRLYWESRNLIDVKRPGDSIPKLAVSSSLEEWTKMGRVLFSRANYQQAVLCFERAGSSLLSDISRGYLLRKQARLLKVGSNERRRAFANAADALLACAQGDHSQSRTCFLRAGECYAEAQKNRKASDAFYNAGEFTRSAQYARKAAAFDRAIEIIREHPVDVAVAESIKSVCKIVYVREQKFDKYLFQSQEEFLECFDYIGCDKTPILLKFNRFEEAGDIAASKDNNIDAIELFLRSGSELSLQKASGCLVDEWWKTFPLNAQRHEKAAPALDKLSRLSAQIKEVPNKWKKELSMFQAILKDDRRTLHGLTPLFIKEGKHVEAIRCYFHIYSAEQHIDELPLDKMHIYLEDLYAFGSRMRQILLMSHAEFTQSPYSQRLLGYRLVESNQGQEAVINTWSALKHQFKKDLKTRTRHYYPISRTNEKEEYFTTVENVGHAGITYLIESLKSVSTAHDNSSRRARAFWDVCDAYAVGNCAKSECKQLHIAPEHMRAHFNASFRIFLHQVLVINEMDSVLTRLQQNGIRRYWMNRLRGSIYPHSSNVGKLANLSIDPERLEPLIVRGLWVLRGWIENAVHHFNASYLDRMLELFIFASAIDRSRAPHYISRAGFERKVLSDANRVDTKSKTKIPLFLDLRNCLFADSMESGIGFIRHVIHEKPNMDVHSLILLLEFITALAVVGLKPDLHGLLIPSSWLFMLGQQSECLKRDIWAFAVLINPLKELASDIHDNAKHLSVNRKPLIEARTFDKRMLIQRIFRCLVLVGANAENNTFQTLVGKAISGLQVKVRSEERVLPRHFVSAEMWEDLVKATIQSLSSSTTDNVIQLVRKDTEVVYPENGVLQHPFVNIRMLFGALNSSPLLSTSHGPKVRIDSQLMAQPGMPQALVPTSHSLDSIQNENVVLPTIPEVRRRTEIIQETQEVVYTDEEHDAAARIQQLYRQFYRRKSSQRKDLVLERFYEECEAASRALESYNKSLTAQKFKLSVLAQRVEHMELEETWEKINHLNANTEFLLEILDQVRPTSKNHAASISATLVASVEKMKLPLDELLKSQTDLAWHYRVAHKGIVQEATTGLPVKVKPTLNTSDLVEF